jgi:hypothetical protein
MKVLRWAVYRCRRISPKIFVPIIHSTDRKDHCNDIEALSQCQSALDVREMPPPTLEVPPRKGLMATLTALFLISAACSSPPTLQSKQGTEAKTHQRTAHGSSDPSAVLTPNSAYSTLASFGYRTGGSIDVVAYGADPTGRIDSTNVFNAALAATVKVDRSGVTHYGSISCPALIDAQTPAKFKLTGTIEVPYETSVYCGDALWDFSSASRLAVGVHLGGNAASSRVEHPPYFSVGQIDGPGVGTSSIGVLTGQCMTTHGNNGKTCPSELDGVWVLGHLEHTEIQHWGTGLAYGGNTYNITIGPGNYFTNNGVGEDERFMWQGTFTNGGTNMLELGNTYLTNNLDAYLCASNERTMIDESFEDNVQPYITISTCNLSGINRLTIRSRFENDGDLTQAPAGSPEFVNIADGIGILTFDGSDFVDQGSPVGIPVCWNNTTNDSAIGSVVFQNTYSRLTNPATRALYGVCNMTNLSGQPRVTFRTVRPTTQLLSGPNVNLAGLEYTISGTAPGSIGPNNTVAFAIPNNNGLFTSLTCINQTGGTCTRAPSIDVFDISKLGIALRCSTSQQTLTTVSTQAETLPFNRDDPIGIYVSTRGADCAAPSFLLSAQVIEFP